jgi:hypothetical protein
MIESYPCRLCEILAASRTIPVLLPGQRFEDWPICEACWRLLEIGLRRTAPGGPRESLDGTGAQLTEPQLRSLIDAALQADGDIPVIPASRRVPKRQHPVRAELRRIGGDIRDAMAASARGDWAMALESVRMIQGWAVITRRALESMLGVHPVATDLPPLVRAVRAVGRLISDREVDTLAPDDLRVRMHAVLDVLDRELQTLLEPPVEAPGQADRGLDPPADGLSGPEKP